MLGLCACNVGSGDAPAQDGGVGAVSIVGAMIPDDACAFGPNRTFLLKGSFDVGASVDCNKPYTMAIALHNYAVAEPPPDDFVGISIDAAQVTEATVTLWNTDDTLLDTAPHPNPFTQSVSSTLPPWRNGDPGRGLVSVEAIPSELRQTLEPLASRGATVVVEVELSVSAVGGQRIDPTPYRFPIELCVGCLSFCSSTLTPTEIDDLAAGQCADNAGADGRACIDDGC